MRFEDLMEKYQSLKIYERRVRTDSYEELVFYKTELDDWIQLFTEALGPAEKPSGTKPTKEQEQLAKEHGGIRAEQTMFRKDLDESTVIAMFWPWQDNKHCTLKVANIKR